MNSVLIAMASRMLRATGHLSAWNACTRSACGGEPLHLDIQLVIIRGEPGPALVEVADSSENMLVVGAGRRGMLSRMWHGKVSRYCLSHARCPVLAIPHPATARQLGLGPRAWALHHRDLTLDRALRDWEAA